MKKQITIIAIILLATLGIGLYLSTRPQKPGKLDSFATCIKDSGTSFYGAFWCPHCKEQKELFGSSVKLLPYVECSTPDGQNQTQICIDKGVKAYPTWVFPNGEQITGTLSLEELATKTSCPLPADIK